MISSLKTYYTAQRLKRRCGVFVRRYAKRIIALTAVFICLVWYVLKIETNYIVHLNRVIKKFVNETEKKHGFSCSLVGSSLTGKEILLQFGCPEKKSIEEARKLEIECIERFCEMINSCKSIRSHLQGVPFQARGVNLVISFERAHHYYFPPEESIGFVTKHEGKLIYSNAFNDNRSNQIILEEPYEEAYEKVKGSE